MPFNIYDKDRQLVYVKGMLQRQMGTSTLNEDNQKGVIFHVERMPEESPAVRLRSSHLMS